MTADQPIFSRGDVIGGLPARRASTLLYAIEARTALIAARARRAMARFETERSAAEHEQQFLSALADGRSLPARATIQDLDRHAARWASLVPADTALRADSSAGSSTSTACRPRRATSGQRLAPMTPPSRKPISGAQAEAWQPSRRRRSLRDRLRWTRARVSRGLESLPPFWLAFTLTLTETVGAGVLALPIAFAGFGPGGAIALLIVFGVLNMLTVAALVESITRDGRMRYGSSYLGRLIGDYLGQTGPGGPGAGPVPAGCGGFQCCADRIRHNDGGCDRPLRAPRTAALFVVVVVILWRGTLDATVAVAVAVGSINLLLLLVISAIAFVNARPDGLAAAVVTPLAFDASILELIFGVALVAYFGHTSAGHAAKVVLAREPSGRHLLAGNVAAMLVAMVVYIVFVLVVTAAVGSDELAGYEGTALTLLAVRVGPAIDVLGTVYVVLAVGLASIYMGLGLFNQVADLHSDVRGLTPGRPGRFGPRIEARRFRHRRGPAHRDLHRR